MKHGVGVWNVSGAGAGWARVERGTRGAVDAGWRDADVEARQTRDAPRVAPKWTFQAETSAVVAHGRPKQTTAECNQTDIMSLS